MVEMRGVLWGMLGVFGEAAHLGDALVEVLEGVGEGHVGTAVGAPCQQGEAEPHGGAVAVVEYGTIGAQHACFTCACD